jgi:2,5-diketo-D-gluconate reductase A
MTIPSLRLNDGHTIPQIGLGTASLNDDTIAPVLVTAIAAGYRHIDTAYRYGNQRGVGKGVRASGIAREELFVTTKLDGEFQGNNRAIAGLDECLRQLDMEYVDLLLIHWPLPQRNEYISTWQTFEQLLASGKTRSIGVSNFKPAHLERLAAEATIHPVANQIQLSPYITRRDHVDYDRAHGIVTVAWSPLGQGKGLLDEQCQWPIPSPKAMYEMTAGFQRQVEAYAQAQGLTRSLCAGGNFVNAYSPSNSSVRTFFTFG